MRKILILVIFLVAIAVFVKLDITKAEESNISVSSLIENFISKSGYLMERKTRTTEEKIYADKIPEGLTTADALAFVRGVVKEKNVDIVKSDRIIFSFLGFFKKEILIESKEVTFDSASVKFNEKNLGSAIKERVSTGAKFLTFFIVVIPVGLILYIGNINQGLVAKKKILHIDISDTNSIKLITFYLFLLSIVFNLFPFKNFSFDKKT